MFEKRKVKKLEEEYSKVIDQYDSLFDESVCRTCDCYFDGNVDLFIDRFKNCSNCTKGCERLLELAKKMDDIIMSIDRLS